jgi:haloalkane dehalogenase
VAAENPERFARIIIGNGALPTGFKGPLPPIATVLPFLAWRAFATYSPWFPISGIVDFGCLKKLSPGELAAYDAPFPDRRARAGARMFPRLVPLSPGDPSIEPNRRAWEVLRRWQKPFLTVFSDGDPITRGGDRAFRAQVPGASGQPHATPHAGHFLQEDAGPELARRINAFIASTPA